MTEEPLLQYPTTGAVGTKSSASRSHQWWELIRFDCKKGLTLSTVQLRMSEMKAPRGQWMELPTLGGQRYPVWEIAEFKLEVLKGISLGLL